MGHNSETFFPANLFATTEENKSNTTKARINPEHKVLVVKFSLFLFKLLYLFVLLFFATCLVNKDVYKIK